MKEQLQATTEQHGLRGGVQQLIVARTATSDLRHSQQRAIQGHIQRLRWMEPTVWSVRQVKPMKMETRVLHALPAEQASTPILPRPQCAFHAQRAPSPTVHQCALRVGLANTWVPTGHHASTASLVEQILTTQRRHHASRVKPVGTQ